MGEKMRVSMTCFYLVKHGEGISRYVEELQRFLLDKNVLSSFSAPEFGAYTRLIYPAAAIKFLMHFSKKRDSHELNHIHLPIPSLAVLFSKLLKKPNKCIFQIWNPPYSSREIFDLAQIITNSRKLASLGLKDLNAPVVVSSQYMRQVITADGASWSYFIPAAVDTRKLSFSSNFRKTRETDDPVILYYGHLTKWKGVENLIKAMPLVIKEYPSTRLKIVWTGHGHSYDKILQLIKELRIFQKVTIKRGLCHDIVHILDKADIGVIPLLSPIATASPPRTLLESMSRGLPLVATKIGGVSEIVKHKETGLLVDPSPKDIAEGILTLLFDDSLRCKISVTARKYVETYHDWQRVGPLYIKLYEELT
jgi:glycosyltransferase involved in cell wall biosynthesis